MGMEKYDIIEAETKKWHATRSYHASAIKRAQTIANKNGITMEVSYDGSIDRIYPEGKYPYVFVKNPGTDIEEIAAEFPTFEEARAYQKAFGINIGIMKRLDDGSLTSDF